jgi:hypothetical protein
MGAMCLDKSVEFGERLDWPVVWPRGTCVAIVQSSDKPQLEPPNPARPLRHPADLARALDKRVANAITLKLDQ